MGFQGEWQEAFLALLGSVGWEGVPLLLLFQALQIVIAFIPGGVVEVVGGMLYGPLWGTIISVAGIFCGTGIAFYLAQKLGQPFVQKMVSPKSFAQYARICNDKRFEALTLLLFFLPGVPKDVLIYVIGMGSASKRLAVLASLVRVPSIAVSVYAGSLFGEGNINQSILLYGIFLLVGAAGVLLHHKILKRIDQQEKRDPPA